MPRYLALPANLHGRDFVVGDLHGQYSVLRSLLEQADFQSDIDRLFLVGDLIDRGPENEKCLQLLLEPNVKAVQGNHELMFYQAATNSSPWMTLKDYWHEDNGGGWTRDWFERKAPELTFWAHQVSRLPYVIHVEAGRRAPFWMVHAELWSPYCDITETNVQRVVETLNDEQERVFQWSRQLAREHVIGRRMQLPGPVYCGHTPVPTPGVEQYGHVNLDAGAGAGGWAKQGFIVEPRLYLWCHTTQQSWAAPVPQTQTQLTSSLALKDGDSC